MTRYRIALVVLILSVVAVSCGGAADPTTTTPSTDSTTSSAAVAPVPTDYAGFRAQPTACSAEAPEPVAPMQFTEPTDEAVGEPIRATITTSCGLIVIELDPELAPETVNSFVFLAEQGYFDGSVSHRVLPGFMMQAGDPTATGRGGPGYTVPDEFPEEGFVYQRGVVAMANAGSGTTGSQFFIMFDTADWLPPAYTVIGEVVEGLDVLDRIATVPLGHAPTSPDPSPSTPLETVYLETVTVDR